MATRTATSTTSIAVDIDTTGQVQFKRAAVTGDVSIAADANTSTIGANIVTNAKSAQMAADTVKANNTGSTANASDVGMAINTVLGRGPTGHIDDLLVDSSLAISDTGLGRAALTGAITAAAGSNTTTLANDAVLTANILDANVTTSKIALNAVGNQRAAQMAAKTVKGNATTSTANAQDMTISGGLYTDDTSVLKSKSGIGYHYIFNSAESGDPTTGMLGFNDSTDIANVTIIRIHETTLGGRSLDTYYSTVTGGRLHLKSNNAAGTSFGVFDVVGSASDSGAYRGFTVTPLNAVGVMPTNGEELVVYYEAIASDTDVLAINDAAKVVRYDPSTRVLLDVDDVSLSGSSSVANYPALVALDTTTYADFAVKVNTGLNSSVWTPNGVNWLPVNGMYLQARSNVASSAITVANNVTWAATDSTVSNGAGGTYINLAGTAHGLTSASVGAALVQTNLPNANWPAIGTLHTIQAIVDANNIRVTTAWVAGMGSNAPVFNLTSEYGVVLQATVPALRANSRYIFESALKGGLVASSSKVKATLGISTGSTVLTTWTGTTSASNNIVPFRVGFKNRNSVSQQDGLWGASSSGFAAGGAATAPALDMSLGTEVFQIELQANTVDNPVSLHGYTIKIEG